jgi:hypothetical protein
MDILEVDIMDQKRPYILASNQLCYDANPTLRNTFCALTGRPIGQPNYNWTEQDVVVAMLARGLNKNDAGKNDSDNGQAGNVEPGRSFNIRRDVSSGNVMAVRPTSSSDDAVLFVVGS